MTFTPLHQHGKQSHTRPETKQALRECLYTYAGLAPSCYTVLTGSSHGDLLVLHLQNRMKLNPGISRILAQRRKLGFEEELVHSAGVIDSFADLQFTILDKGAGLPQLQI